jgi:hypothetical protein
VRVREEAAHYPPCTRFLPPPPSQRRLHPTAHSLLPQAFFVKIKLSDPRELDGLLDKAAYDAHVASSKH